MELQTILFSLISGFICIQAQFYGQPEQVHLSMGGSPSQMWVTWVTLNSTKESICEFGQTLFENITIGSETEFIDGGAMKRRIYIHRALMTGLIPGNTYYYHVGGPQYGWSNLFHFRALKPRPGGYKYAVFGDMGNVNSQSLSRLQREVQMGNIDMILHIGDMAYDMADNNALKADQFFRQIEPIAAFVPYMVTPGNHEMHYNFSNYASRFTMPFGIDNINAANFFHSFDLGPAHFIGFSTEFYFYPEYGLEQARNQFEWLKNDLQKANANRNNVPWIITMGHRPMYCSNDDGDDCTHYESITRTGFPFSHLYGLEKLFYENGVDLALWAHEHSYERMWPVYNRTIYNGTKSPYNNPPAPVHIVTGSAGCPEDLDGWITQPPWSAFRASKYGYGHLQIPNATHLYFEQISDALNGKVIDSIWLVKQNHTVYSDEIRNKQPGIYVGY